MKISKLPDNVKVHETAWRVIKTIAIGDKKLAARIVQRIVDLGLDPKPNNLECNSKLVQNLKEDGIYVRRLHCVDIKDFRIFYCVKKSGRICVYSVVFAKGAKHDEAYEESSHHYQLIKLLYSKFWRECQ
jgi:mRNA-degrading endonuclease RelE of RelBE toxin-antitoxin system